jgi:hypothetical protein
VNSLAVWDASHVLTGLRGQYVLPILNADLSSGMPFIVTEVATHGSAADAMQAGVGVAIDRGCPLGAAGVPGNSAGTRLRLGAHGHET